MGAYDFENAKKEYRKFCKEEKSINIYMQDWFLDAVLRGGEEWRVVLVKENEQIVAAFPFGYRKSHGMNYIFAPWQCARMGIWMRDRIYEDQEEKINVLGNYLKKIVEGLPPYDSFQIPFDYKLQELAPVYWFGFSASPRYSMVIQKETDDYILAISKKRRERVRRAMRRYHVEEGRLSKEDYWDFLVRTYESALQEHDACIIRSVLDEEEHLVAVCIILEDSERCYHQLGAQMQGKDMDATSYAVYESINYALRNGKKFDFEGSMIQGVCEFNSSFNPDWEQYYTITNYSKKYQFLSAANEITKIICRKN